MGMSGYTKLFNSILASTIWRAPDKTRIVWITLLAMAGKDGVAEGSLPGLADLARVSIEDAKLALEELVAPDEYSRTEEYGGRRIEKVDGGWQILNHAKYRERMSADERREYFRKKQEEHRERKKMSNNVKDVNDSEGQSKEVKEITHTEAESEAKAEQKKKQGKPAASKPDFLESLRTNPAYSKLDLDEQFGRMDAWLIAHPGRKKTPRFVLNWLNKVEPELPRQAKSQREQSMV